MSDEPSTVDGQPPRRARSNGLPAPAWVAVRDIDPRLAAALLDALGDASVAAYVAPAVGMPGIALEHRLPAQPTDRLWVDARFRTEAERILASALPELQSGLVADPTSDGTVADDDWAAIVAMFNAGDPGAAAWPAAEDVDRDAPPPAPTYVVRPTAPNDDEEHFVPPDPPPAPPSTPATRYGWLALLGGVALLVAPTLLGYEIGTGLAVLAIAAIIGGFVTLVYQMKDSPPTDSGPDDGAVV